MTATLPEVIACLEQARALIADAVHWTTGALARDARGHDVDPPSPEACRWCANGALDRVTLTTADMTTALALQMEALRWLGAVSDVMGTAYTDYDKIVFVNDQLGHATTLAMFDRAIAEARCVAAVRGEVAR